MKPVILIAGEKESGKDSFADMLADALKNAMLSSELHEILDQTNGPRRFTGVHDWLQTYGTEWFRDSVAPSIWVDKAIRAIAFVGEDEHVDGSADGFIISDCRFGNEFKQMFDALDACTIPIPTGGFGEVRWAERGKYKCFVFKVWRKNRPTAKADAHRSETSVQEIDAFHPSVIDNSGTLDEIRDRAVLEASLILKSIRAPMAR